jgi:hypothetical protein
VDHMTGGAGNDTYVVDTGLDVVTELADHGHDLVQASLSLDALGANVEDLVFTDTGPHIGIRQRIEQQVVGHYGTRCPQRIGRR